MPIDREAEGERARARYSKALRAFQAANEALQARLEAQALPTEDEIVREEEARSELASARQALCNERPP
jgi:hypothetical protein